MKVNYNKVMKWFFLSQMVGAIILYFINQNLEFRVVQLIALTSFYLHMYSLFNDEQTDVKQDTGDI